MTNFKKYTEITDVLFRFVRDKSFSGYDPFDGLNSSLFQVAGLGKYPLARLAWIQFHKRSPFNFRPMVGVPETRNPKGIALVVLGLLLRYRDTKDKALLEEAINLGDWLLSQRSECEIWGAAAWGYNFDWQARAFFVPKGKPNMITTVYVAQAMEELAAITGFERFAQPLIDAAEFIVGHLYFEHADGPFFRYIPEEPALVHNANLWGAALVARAGVSSGKNIWLELARRACVTSVKAQDERGAWAYGGRDHHAFVDSFHTGFNLEALHRYSIATGSDEFSGAIEKGMVYYRENMFLPDGAPKYYDNKTYPIDMHTTAQAVITLLAVGGSDSDRELAEKVLGWSMRNMYDEKDGIFYYQKGKIWTNRIPYIRWTQAWMYYALAFFINSSKEEQK